MKSIILIKHVSSTIFNEISIINETHYLLDTDYSDEIHFIIMEATLEEEQMSIGLTTVFSLKGGVGKTALSMSIALEENHNGAKVPVLTNDPVSMVHTVMGKSLTMKLEPKQDFPKQLDENSDVVLDLGGFVDDRIVGVMEKSRNILIPTFGDLPSVQATVATYVEIKNALPDSVIAIVVNRTDKKDFYDMYNFFRDKCKGSPVLLIKQSRAFDNLYSHKKSIGQMMEENKLLARAYGELHGQLNDLISYLKGDTDGKV